MSCSDKILVKVDVHEGPGGSCIGFMEQPIPSQINQEFSFNTVLPKMTTSPANGGAARTSSFLLRTNDCLSMRKLEKLLRCRPTAGPNIIVNNKLREAAFPGPSPGH